MTHTHEWLCPERRLVCHRLASSSNQIVVSLFTRADSHGNPASPFTTSPGDYVATTAREPLRARAARGPTWRSGSAQEHYAARGSSIHAPAESQRTQSYAEKNSNMSLPGCAEQAH